MALRRACRQTDEEEDAPVVDGRLADLLYAVRNLKRVSASRGGMQRRTRPPKAPARAPAPMKMASRLEISSLRYQKLCWSAAAGTEQRARAPVVQGDSLAEQSLADADKEARSDDAAEAKGAGHTRGGDGPDERAEGDGGRGQDGFGKEGAGDGEGDVGDEEGRESDAVVGVLLRSSIGARGQRCECGPNR